MLKSIIAFAILTFTCANPSKQIKYSDTDNNNIENNNNNHIINTRHLFHDHHNHGGVGDFGPIGFGNNFNPLRGHPPGNPSNFPDFCNYPNPHEHQPLPHHLPAPPPHHLPLPYYPPPPQHHHPPPSNQFPHHSSLPHHQPPPHQHPPQPHGPHLHPHIHNPTCDHQFGNPDHYGRAGHSVDGGQHHDKSINSNINNNNMGNNFDSKNVDDKNVDNGNIVPIIPTPNIAPTIITTSVPNVVPIPTSTPTGTIKPDVNPNASEQEENIFGVDLRISVDEKTDKSQTIPMKS